MTLVLLRLFFWPLSFGHLGAKNENGRGKLPAVWLGKRRNSTIPRCLDLAKPKSRQSNFSQALQPFKPKD